MIVDKTVSETGRASLLQKLKHWTGLDRAIAFTVMARFWSAAAGFLTVLLIVRFLTPKEQGYYYTFSSVVALQVIFELGFSFVVLQLAAHERAQLTFLPNGQVEGNPVSRSRLASILQKSVRWYSAAALLVVATLIPAGLHFFAAHQVAQKRSPGRHHGACLQWPPESRFNWTLFFRFWRAAAIYRRWHGCGWGRECWGALQLAWTALVTRHGLFSPAMVIVGEAIVGLAFLLSAPRRAAGKRPAVSSCRRSPYRMAAGDPGLFNGGSHLAGSAGYSSINW